MDFHFFLVILFFFKCPTTFPFCFPNVPLRLGFNVFSISYFYLSTISAFCQQLFYFFLFICIIMYIVFLLSIRDADKISIYYILYVCLTLHIALFIKKRGVSFKHTSFVQFSLVFFLHTFGTESRIFISHGIFTCLTAFADLPSLCRSLCASL